MRVLLGSVVFGVVSVVMLVAYHPSGDLLPPTPTNFVRDVGIATDRAAKKVEPQRFEGNVFVDEAFVDEPQPPEQSGWEGGHVRFAQNRFAIPQAPPAVPLPEVSPPDSWQARDGVSKEQIDLAHGKKFVIFVHRRSPHPQECSVIERTLAGKRVNVLSRSPDVSKVELCIFAQAVEVQHRDGLQLSCPGEVVVLAGHSLLRGSDLDYADGVFKIAATKIQTADAEIRTQDSSFEFDAGAISVEELDDVENVVPEHDLPPTFAAPLPLP